MSLLGSTIRMVLYYPNLNTTGSVPATAVVSTGAVEFWDVNRFDVNGDPANLVNTDVDFTADQMFYRVDDPRANNSIFTPAAFNGYTFQKVGGAGPAIYSATVNPTGNTVGLQQNDITVVNGQLRINFESIRFSNNDAVTLNIGFTYQGGNGVDNLVGGRFNDQLLGGGAADRLTGALGADVLNGGASGDVFDFNAVAESGSATSARDVIVAFDGAGAAAGDRIDLSTIDANLSQAGNQAFVFGTATGIGRVWATSGPNAETIIFANVDGDAAIEFGLRIQDGTRAASAYTSADFVL